MKIKMTLLALTLSFISLFGSIQKSIIPSMDQLIITELAGKINEEQTDELCEAFLPLCDLRLRVMSFNMLLNWNESHLKQIDRWESRKGRVIDYIQWSHPDVIGSQELQADQLDDLLCALDNEYDYYGIGVADGVKEGDIPAIFYRADRLELIEGKTFYFSETPEEMSESPFGSKNTFTFCHFRDRKSGHEFVALNTHLAFGNIERRYYEACKLRDFLLTNESHLPLLITGDFNTFSFRQELDLPFYDGDRIVRIIEDGHLTDSSRVSLFGHFGPISSTNFSSEKKRPFCSEGEPGIILDHIFVSKGIQVLAHGIDPAKVDGHYPSDHFPVIVDIIFEEPGHE